MWEERKGKEKKDPVCPMYCNMFEPTGQDVCVDGCVNECVFCMVYVSMIVVKK